MRRKFGFKPTKRQAAMAFAAAHDFYAASSDKGAAAPRWPVPKQRAAPRPSGKPTEADVVRAVAELLAVHPRVLFAVRAQSGSASYEHKSGEFRPVHFYRVLTGQPVTITDFWGLLRPENGQPARAFAIECKREDFKGVARNEREMRQSLFISMVKHCGGLGGFVRNADEAKAILDG